MQPRPLAFLSVLLATALSLAAQSAPTRVTTTKKSAVAIGSGSFALVKGTKLEVVGREGDLLVVKYRALQGKIPVADTDFPADGFPESAEPVAAAAAVTAAPVVKPTPAGTKPAAPAQRAKPATPPALDPAGKPATNYGKAVQKAKQVTGAHKSTHVDPTKGIMDDESKK